MAVAAATEGMAVAEAEAEEMAVAEVPHPELWRMQLLRSLTQGLWQMQWLWQGSLPYRLCRAYAMCGSILLLNPSSP